MNWNPEAWMGWFDPFDDNPVRSSSIVMAALLLGFGIAYWAGREREL